MYQCLGKYLCLKSNRNGGQKEDGTKRELRPCKGLRGRKFQRCRKKVSQQNTSPTRRPPKRPQGTPCIRFRNRPVFLRMCRRRNGIRRQKRETSFYEIEIKRSRGIKVTTFFT